jgi:hypothetical protein
MRTAEEINVEIICNPKKSKYLIHHANEEEERKN